MAEVQDQQELRARRVSLRPEKMRDRVKRRAAVGARLLARLLKREQGDGVTPFPSARARTALTMVSTRPRGPVKSRGVR